MSFFFGGRRSKISLEDAVEIERLKKEEASRVI